MIIRVLILECKNVLAIKVDGKYAVHMKKMCVPRDTRNVMVLRRVYFINVKAMLPPLLFLSIAW